MLAIEMKQNARCPGGCGRMVSADRQGNTQACGHCTRAVNSDPDTCAHCGGANEGYGRDEDRCYECHVDRSCIEADALFDAMKEGVL